MMGPTYHYSLMKRDFCGTEKGAASDEIGRTKITALVSLNNYQMTNPLSVLNPSSAVGFMYKNMYINPRVEKESRNHKTSLPYYIDIYIYGACSPKLQLRIAHHIIFL